MLKKKSQESVSQFYCTTIGIHQREGQYKYEKKKNCSLRTPLFLYLTVSTLRFLSLCCSVNLSWSHCHRDGRYFKIACLLDLPWMERLFMFNSLSFSPSNVAAAARIQTMFSLALIPIKTFFPHNTV